MALAGETAKREHAQALFDEARQLMFEGRFSEACPKLAESHRIDPAPGTLLNLALCHEQIGRTASAWGEYHLVVSMAELTGDLERKRIASERIAELEPLLSRLSFKVPEPPVAGLWVALDGVRLSASSLETRLPVDPGPHVVEFGAPGKRTVRLVLEIRRPGETRVVELVALADQPLASPSPALPPSQGNAGAKPWSKIFGAYGVAALGLVATGYCGSRAKSEWDERNRLCLPRCTEDAVRAKERANDWAWAANASAAVALVGLAAGTYWLVLTPSPGRAEAISDQSQLLLRHTVGRSAPVTREARPLSASIHIEPGRPAWMLFTEARF